VGGEREDKGVRSGRNKGTKTWTENKGSKGLPVLTVHGPRGPRSTVHGPGPSSSIIVHPQLVQSLHTTSTCASTLLLLLFLVRALPHNPFIHAPLKALFCPFLLCFLFFSLIRRWSKRQGNKKNKNDCSSTSATSLGTRYSQANPSHGETPGKTQIKRQRKQKTQRREMQRILYNAIAKVSI